MELKWYAAEIFEPHLAISLFSALVGISAAAYYGEVHPYLSFLVVAGALLAQMSANMMDDYFDYNIGIDKETIKTRFSGGSKVMEKRLVDPKNILLLSVVAMALAGAISLYLLRQNPAILPLLIVGALSIPLYAAYLVKLPFMAELTVAVNFALISAGAFMVSGGYAAIPYPLLFSIIPVGLVCGNALLVNEVPDRKTDRKYGRKSGAVMLYDPKRIASYYALLQSAAYIIVAAGSLFGYLPIYSLAVLAAIPLSASVFRAIGSYKSPASYVRGMAAHASGTAAFLVLLSASYLLALAIA
jgi:1,4-dihydroxy-2-naphthoate octaprenyltransferase